LKYKAGRNKDNNSSIHDGPSELLKIKGGNYTYAVKYKGKGKYFLKVCFAK